MGPNAPAEDVENAEEATSPAPSPSLCELQIGEGVRSFTLLSHDERRLRRFRYPGEGVELPPGEYSVRRIVLINGFEAEIDEKEETPFMLTPGEPCVLKIGGLLHPTAQIDRSGTYVSLKYQVVDDEGRVYERENSLIVDRDSPPRFVVLLNGEEVGGEAFQYG